MRVERGKYLAGFSRPFMVTNGQVAAKLKTMGFAPTVFHERDAGAPPVDPKGSPSYSDDWDVWIETTYTGKPADLDLGGFAAWVLRRGAKPVGPPRAAPTSTKAAEPGAKSDGEFWTLVLLALLVL